MMQVYCDNEKGVNKWLEENYDYVKIIDIKIAMNNDGEYIMIVYRK